MQVNSLIAWSPCAPRRNSSSTQRRRPTSRAPSGPDCSGCSTWSRGGHPITCQTGGEFFIFIHWVLWRFKCLNCEDWSIEDCGYCGGGNDEDCYYCGSVKECVEFNFSVNVMHYSFKSEFYKLEFLKFYYYAEYRSQINYFYYLYFFFLLFREKYVYLMSRLPLAINSNYYALDHYIWTPTNRQVY